MTNHEGITMNDMNIMIHFCLYQQYLLISNLVQKMSVIDWHPGGTETQIPRVMKQKRDTHLNGVNPYMYSL